MGLKNATQPRFPTPPMEYDPQYMDQLINAMRLYFAQLNNASPAIFASQNVGSSTVPVISAMTFAQPDLTTPGASKISLPTDLDFANLRSGDVYYDRSGGVAASYPLRVKL
jgi:hypothetical protein